MRPSVCMLRVCLFFSLQPCIPDQGSVLVTKLGIGQDMVQRWAILNHN